MNKSSSQQLLKRVFHVITPKYSSKHMSRTEGSLLTKIPPTPGPGQYELPHESIAKGPKMTKASRSSDRLNTFPGVGSYHLPSTAPQAYTFREYRRKFIRLMPTPSAASYNIKSPTPSGGRLPAAKRSFQYISQNNFPGPGSYTLPNTTFAIKSRKKITENKRSSQHIVNQSKIDAFQSFLESKQHGRLMPKFKTDVRHYEFLDTLNVANPKLINRSPGPGRYSISSKIDNKKVTFTKQKRPELFQIPDGPGVGKYCKIELLGKNYKKVQIQKEIEWRGFTQAIE